MLISFYIFTFFEILNLYPIIKDIGFSTTIGSLINVLGLSFTFVLGFDYFCKHPLQSRLVTYISLLLALPGSCVFWGDYRICIISAYAQECVICGAELLLSFSFVCI